MAVKLCHAPLVFFPASRANVTSFSLQLTTFASNEPLKGFDTGKVDLSWSSEGFRYSPLMKG